MYMTREQIRIEAGRYNRGLSKHPMSVPELTEVLVGFYAHLQKLQQTNVSGSLTTQDEILAAADKYGFRVPYDGSNNFYDDEAIAGRVKNKNNVKLFKKNKTSV